MVKPGRVATDLGCLAGPVNWAWLWLGAALLRGMAVTACPGPSVRSARGLITWPETAQPNGRASASRSCTI